MGDGENVTDDHKKKVTKRFWNRDIPVSSHYHVSWLHKQIVTHVTTSIRHGYVITAGKDGIVKFWKRLEVEDSSNEVDKNVTSGKKEDPQHPCLEFVKAPPYLIPPFERV